MKPSVASLYQAVELAQEIRPLLIGERCNANGSKKFRDLLLAGDYDGCVQVALAQETGGAHVLDLCTAYAGRNEREDLTRLVAMLARAVRLPLMIDSTSPDCVEACLRIYPGRAIVNSINLEDGGKNLERICRLAKKYGAAVVALTIHESGMAMTCDEKVATARRIHDLAVGHYGLRPHDLLFDPLTFTVGSGDESLRGAAMETLAALRRIKTELPGVFTLLGVSNVSFGLSPASRRVLTSVFLHEAVEAGLDAAIVDAAKVLPLASIPDEDRAVSLDLLYNRVAGGEEATPLARFIRHFEARTQAAPTTDDGEAAAKKRSPAEQDLHAKVVAGDKDGVEDLVWILLRRYPATAILNQVLVPAMRHVGDLFGRGEILLPFVLQSAEVMKHAVTLLEPHMEKGGEAHSLTVLLATVQGDVHDIGKNLVDILLSNNGYRVVNMGIKAPAETIIAKAKEVGAGAIGLSGLLVKSAIVMQESLPQYEAAGLRCPILLGGAALTRRFVAESCAPGYSGPVVYCPDAFAGLRAMREFEAGTLRSTAWASAAAGPGAAPSATDESGEPAVESVDRSVPVPEPPFMGVRTVTGIAVEPLFGYLNEEALFRGRWGFRQGKSSAEDYAALVRERVRPVYEALRRRAAEEPELFAPRVVYGYFRCWREGDLLHVERPGGGGATTTFAFARRRAAPRLCVADYFRSRGEGGDVAGLMTVTLGEGVARAEKALFDSNAYHDYLMLHGLAVELTDAVAEYWHGEMRREWGIADAPPAPTAPGRPARAYRGERYAFGYPACPDLEMQAPLFELLHPESIGVTLTENYQMVPEVSTSAIVVHHPQAHYFSI